MKSQWKEIILSLSIVAAIALSPWWVKKLTAVSVSGGGSGGAAGDLVSDSSPQLGGDLDLNSHYIVFNGGTIEDINESGTMENAADTNLSTALAVKTYVDAQAAKYIPSLSDSDGECLSAATGTAETGKPYCADADNYDPCGLGGTANYLFIFVTGGTTTENPKAILDEDGNLLVDTLQANINIIAATGAYTLTAAEMNSIVTNTSTGDIDIPSGECDSPNGKWLIVKNLADNITTSITSLNTLENFYLDTGVAIGTNEELDVGTNIGNQVTVTCLGTNTWWVTGAIGDPADGGAAD